MKKIFTLIAAAVLAVSANAQDWTCGNIYLADGTTLVDNDYATVTTANNTTSGTLIEDEGGNPTPVTYFDKTFTHYLGVRVTDAPSAANPTGTAHESNVAIVVNAKKNTDMTLYYKVGATKSIDCYDQAAKEAVSIVQEASNPGDEYLFCKGVYKFQEGHTYTIYAKGGTIQLHALGFGEGTYVKPAEEKYTIKADCNGVVELTDIKITFLNNTSKGSTANAGTWTFSTANAKADQNACEIKFEPTKSGKLTILYAAKVASNKSINMFVNGDTNTTIPCKLTADDTEVASGSPAANGINKNDGVYYYVEAGKTYNFYTAGTKYAVSVLSFDSSVASGVATVTDNAAAAKAVKVAKNGSIVIVKDGAEYSVAGAQMK